jgi:hypothetical protein
MGNCTDTLENLGYEVTPARAFACGIAASYPNPYYGAAICWGALSATGVYPIVAWLACGAGTVPQFNETQWCSNSNSACLNSWSEGQYVDDYAGGPDISNDNSDFGLVYNDATGYFEILYTGPGAYAGDCIGDASNNSGLADAGLVGCGTTSGSQGWGTNMNYGTSGCPNGEIWFYDYHWNGYLGPSGGNGTHFYLNKPTRYCFTYTYMIYDGPRQSAKSFTGALKPGHTPITDT